MKAKRLIILTLFFLVIGFATVVTNLIINGNSIFGVYIDDFEVYFSEAIIDGEDYSNEVISDDKKTITFNIDEFKYAGDTSKLEYEVTNASTSYDAEVKVECEGITEEISIVQNPDEQIVKARQVGKGTVTITLNKTVIEEKEIEYTCRLVVNAIERDSVDNTPMVTANTYVIEGNYVDQEGNPISNANLVIYSEERHYVTTHSKGYFVYNGLEKGAHEIYYVDDTLENIKNISKDDIRNKSIAKGKFQTTTYNSFVFDDKSLVTNLNIETSIEFCSKLYGKQWEYEYINEEDILMIPCEGYYSLEVWGAQGGSYNATYQGGFGGYSRGVIDVTANNILYINVGGQGTYTSGLDLGGYNGGGNSTPDITMFTGSGGGATHISTISGLLSSLSNDVEKVLIVAGGGGGAAQDASGIEFGSGGHAGGYQGLPGTATYAPAIVGGGGSQTAGGTSNINVGRFGVGGNAANYEVSRGGGGGGGYYGGGSGLSNGAAGGGGSSYIGNPILLSKAMYCYNCLTSDEETMKTVSVETASETPIKNTPKKGNGYVRVTYMNEIETKCVKNINKTWEFDYTGNTEQFFVECDGLYKLETWGAQGGSYDLIYRGGYGGYSVGYTNLKTTNNIFVTVGGQGTYTSGLDLGGYNGGGNSTPDVAAHTGSGGGATHIAFDAGLLSEFSSKVDKLLIVSGGGGGAGQDVSMTLFGTGGDAGGFEGKAGLTTSTSIVGGGGTQSAGGTSVINVGGFGFGGNAAAVDGSRAGGGGAGFYGGGSGQSLGAAGGGGSSYIANALLKNKAMYCFECLPSEDESLKTISVSVASDLPMINTPKKGNGYAKITLVSLN